TVQRCGTGAQEDRRAAAPRRVAPARPLRDARPEGHGRDGPDDPRPRHRPGPRRLATAAADRDGLDGPLGVGGRGQRADRVRVGDDRDHHREPRHRGEDPHARGDADLPGLGTYAERVIPSRVTELGAVLQALREEAVGAVLLAGKFWTRDVLGARRGDATFAEMAARAGALTDVRILDVIVQTLADLRITLLDQREFLGDDLAAAGCWSARTPTEEERRDVERGLGLARQAAEARIGQTVVLRR